MVHHLTYTSKVRRYGGPHPDAAHAESLTDRQLHVEQRKPLYHQGDQIWNQERTLGQITALAPCFYDNNGTQSVGVREFFVPRLSIMVGGH